MKALHAILFAAVTILGIVAVRDVVPLGDKLPWHELLDFSDFYCAGAALDNRADPYRYEPLHGCEHTVNVGNTDEAKFLLYTGYVAVPAPQPPYDFLPFMALARLPFGDARLVQAVAIVAAAALCAVALAGLGVPLEVAAAALALSAAYIQLEMGQIVPFALLALVLCGLALARGRDALAGILAALTAVAPIVGVPVIVAMLLFVPRARATVIACTLALGGVSLFLVGPHGLLEYVTVVLPAHSDAELYFPFQYSLSWLLATLGAAPAVAKVAGTTSYVALAAVGLVFAHGSSKALRRRELLAFVPALCVLVGGPFLHQEELCFAIPALTVFATVTQGKTRALAAAALCALSIPWLLVWPVKQLLMASIFVCAVMLMRLRIDLRIAFAILCVIAAAIFAFQLRPPALWPLAPGTKLPIFEPNAFAQGSWRYYINSLKGADLLWLYIKIPAWAALLASVGISAGYARRSRAASGTTAR